MPWPKAVTPKIIRDEQIEDTPQKYQKCEDESYTEIALKITTQKSKNQMEKQLSREKPLSNEKKWHAKLAQNPKKS